MKYVLLVMLALFPAAVQAASETVTETIKMCKKKWICRAFPREHRQPDNVKKLPFLAPSCACDQPLIQFGDDFQALKKAMGHDWGAKGPLGKYEKDAIFKFRQASKPLLQYKDTPKKYITDVTKITLEITSQTVNAGMFSAVTGKKKKIYIINCTIAGKIFDSENSKKNVANKLEFRITKDDEDTAVDYTADLAQKLRYHFQVSVQFLPAKLVAKKLYGWQKDEIMKRRAVIIAETEKKYKRAQERNNQANEKLTSDSHKLANEAIKDAVKYLAKNQKNLTRKTVKELAKKLEPLQKDLSSIAQKINDAIEEEQFEIQKFAAAELLAGAFQNFSIWDEIANEQSNSESACSVEEGPAAPTVVKCETCNATPCTGEGQCAPLRRRLLRALDH